MLAFVSRRLAQSLITVFAVSVIVFIFMNLAGDPAILLLPPEAKPADVQLLRESLGLNRPAYVRYISFMTHFWYSDQIKSFKYNDRLLPLILTHLQWTLVLAVAALILSLAIGIPLGTLAARRRARAIDVAVRVIAVLGESIPAFVTAIVLMFLFAVQYRVLPVAGLGLRNAVLPVATLVCLQMAILMRLFRSELLDVFSQDYIRTARSKGLRERVVLTRHAFRNAAIPVLTMAGLLLNYLVLGAVVVEPIFAWPGLGWLMVQSVSARDYPVVVGAATIAAVLIAVINLAVDVLQVWIDPRVRTI